MTTLERTTSEIRQTTFEQETTRTDISVNIKSFAAGVINRLSSAVDSFIEANENMTPTQETYMAHHAVKNLDNNS
jgi:hypothetical protein